MVVALIALTSSASAHAQSTPTPHQLLGRELLRELVETKTTHSEGSTTHAAELLATDTAIASPPSPLPAAVEAKLSTVVASMWGPLPIIPIMDTGASDGLFLRNSGMPVYGVTGYFVDPNKAEDG